MDILESLIGLLLLRIELSVDLLYEFFVTVVLSLVTFIDDEAFVYEAVFNGL